MRLPSRALAVLSLVATWTAVSSAQTSKPSAVGGSHTALQDRAAQNAPSVTRVEPPTIAPTSSDAAPQPVGYEADLYCFGYLGDPREQFPVAVLGAQNLYEQTDFVTNDLLYVDGGYDKGLRVGDQFWIVTREQDVLHPATGRSLGRFYQYRGRATVQSIEPHTAIVTVTSACTDIPLGAYLKKFEPIPIPLARRSPSAQPGDPPSGKAKGRIVYTQDGIIALGVSADIMVDLGAADGLQPGDFLTIFRYSTGREYGIGPVGSYWVNIPPKPGVFIPRTYLGEAAVLNVGDRWSIVRITDSGRLIEVGDEVEVK